MSERGAERAELLSDQVGRITIGGHYKPGPSIPDWQLQKLLEEVAPFHLRSRIVEEGRFSFAYDSPHGAFDFDVNRINGTLQISIEPVAAPVTAIPIVPQISATPILPPTGSFPKTVVQVDTQPCPFCGQEIKEEAAKCRFCKEWLQPVGVPVATNPTQSGHSPTTTDGNMQGRKRAGIWVMVLIIILTSFLSLVLFRPSANVSAPAHVPTSVSTTKALTGEQFPQTRLRTLTSGELDNLSLDKLQNVINEMYARHGYDFPGSKGDQFRQYDWYQPVPGRTQDKVEQSFNSFEETNKRLLMQKREELRSVGSTE